MIIKCEERLREAREYSETLDDKSLQECLDKLRSWERNGRTLHLYNDFAPYRLPASVSMLPTGGSS